MKWFTKISVLCEKKNHLTQTQIAQKLHMAQNTYSQYETGRIEWTATLLVQLATLYGVSVDYLLGRE
ncbi:MAG: helix-turn-helix domain-containing protein [Christensenellales bacterium]